MAGLAGIASMATLSPSVSAAPAGIEGEIAAKARALTGGKAVSLRLLMPKGCEDNLRPVISAFFQATGIAIELVETAVDDINTQLTLDAITEEGKYDLALPATFGLPDLVAADAIIPLSDFARKHEPAGFRSGILYETGDSFDDEIYGFQTDGDAYVMFYNRDMLEDPREQKRYADRFGEPLAIPKTWFELDQQMAFFHQPAENRYGGLLFRTNGYLAWEWWVRFHAKGVWPLSETLEPQIASKEGVEALNEMIRATASLAEETSRLGLFENWQRYSQGDVYANIGWGGSQKYLNGPNSKVKGRLVYGPTPGGLVNNELLVTPYFNWGWNYVVTRSSRAPELSYLFALFASSPAVSTESVRQQGGYFDPFRAEHYQDAGIRKTYSDEFLLVHEQSLRAAIPDLYLANQSQYFQSLSDWLGRAMIGKVDAPTALSNVAQQWRLINKRSQPEKQRARWEQLRAKYPESVRNKLKDLG